jgi:hypothetical protein
VRPLRLREKTLGARFRSSHIATDGVDGAGKATLADALAPAVARRGRAVIRASVDDLDLFSLAAQAAQGEYVRKVRGKTYWGCDHKSQGRNHGATPALGRLFPISLFRIFSSPARDNACPGATLLVQHKLEEG